MKLKRGGKEQKQENERQCVCWQSKQVRKEARLGAHGIQYHNSICSAIQNNYEQIGSHLVSSYRYCIMFEVKWNLMTDN